MAEERATHALKGWTANHDDGHSRGQIISAATALLRNKPHRWGLTAKTRKEGGRVRQLVVAGALIAAEIDRLQRAASNEAGRSYKKIQRRINATRAAHVKHAKDGMQRGWHHVNPE